MTKIYIQKRRNEVIWHLALEGYTTGDIAEIIIMDRTWISRIIKKMPKKWTPTFSIYKKA